MLVFLLILALLFLSSLFLKDGKKDQIINEKPVYVTDNKVYKIGNHLVKKPDIITEETCGKIEDETQKEDCYNRLNLGKIFNGSKNLKECLNFTNLNYRNECLIRLIGYSKNVDMCKRLSDHSAQESCIGGVAIALKDQSICDEFKSEPYEYQECRDRVNAFLAPDKSVYIDEAGEVRGVKIEECAKAKTLEYSKLCVGNVLKEGNVLIGYINNEVFENNWNDFYHYRIAVTKEDCSKIILKGGKDACIDMIKNIGFSYYDYDGDNVSDEKELWFSTDPGNPDTDGDGLTDYDEILNYHIDPTNPDTDGDGLTDYDEIKIYKTHPNKPDTDSDGISDGAEVRNGTNPNTGDTDKDRLLDADEVKFGTDINNSDTDDDGMSDFDETRNGFDPLKAGQILADTDGDELLDIDEMFYKTDRFNSDTDDDGVGDKEEIDNLTNPLGEGDMDFDGDGISDKDEIKYETNPSKFDSDDDGLTDYEEIFTHKTDPNNRDCDDDGYLDGEEVKNGYNPLGKGKLRQ